MEKILLLAFFVLMTISVNNCQDYLCGQTKLPPQQNEFPEDVFLSGGRDATPGLFPWTLALEKRDEASSSFVLQCGAVLIDRLWALTSARCVYEDTMPEQYRIVAGQISRSQPSGLEQLIGVEEIIVNPDFIPEPPSYPADIAIIQLTAEADEDDPERPIGSICLPPSNETRYWENPSCAVTGYGLTGVNGSYPDSLREAWIDVIRPGNCELWWTEEGVILDTHQCAYDQVNREVSLCEADLGGPLGCMINGRFDLAGVGSFYRDECNPRFPSIFTSLPQYLDWVLQVTGIPPREGDNLS